EQPSVLDSDDSLRSEILHQSNLLLAKRLDFQAIDDDDTNRLVFLEHRHQYESAGAGRFNKPNGQRISFFIGNILGKVSNMEQLSCCSGASVWRQCGGTRDWLAPLDLDISRRCIMQRGDPERSTAFMEQQRSETRLAKTCCILERGPEHR